MLQHPLHYAILGPIFGFLQAIYYAKTDIEYSGDDPLEVAARGGDIDPYVSYSSHQTLHIILSKTKNSMAYYPRTHPA